MLRIMPLFLLILLLPGFLMAAEELPGVQPQPVELEFSGYKFGQSPAANMVCTGGYCKSQAPGGDGRITFPFSIYQTPGAVSTLSGLLIINPHYTFWNNRLYRAFFQVDCTSQEAKECLDDIGKVLDREYNLTPLSSSEWQQFTTGKQSHVREYITESGAFVRIRGTRTPDGWRMPTVEILDKRTADQVGSTLSPSYKPKDLPLPVSTGK